MNDLDHRLDQILARVTSRDFLNGRSVAGEIPFWIFDYPPAAETRVREHIGFLLNQLQKKKPDLLVRHINLMVLMKDILESRGLLEKSYAMHQAKGEDAVLKAMRAPLDGEKVAKAFFENARPGEAGLILVSGVGSAYPLIRTHNLLNALHPHMGNTPLSGVLSWQIRRPVASSLRRTDRQPILPRIFAWLIDGSVTR
jgi:hypothetical protein